MKRRFAILLLIACLQPSLFAGERPRFTCGVGWGSVIHFYENGYSLYITPDKYLAENFINDWKLNFNAAFELRAGIACRRCELYAYSGYRGYAPGTLQLPAGLRLQLFVGRQKRVEGCFLTADSSVGIPLRKGEIHSFSALCGGGYRLRLSPSFAIDYSLVLNYGRARPNKITDPISNQVIDTEDIRNAFVNQFGIGIGMALVF